MRNVRNSFPPSVLFVFVFVFVCRAPRSAMRSSMCGCCSFTTTSVPPLCSVARCTCAIDAQPSGSAPTWEKTSATGRPARRRRRREHGSSKAGLSPSTRVPAPISPVALRVNPAARFVFPRAAA